MSKAIILILVLLHELDRSACCGCCFLKNRKVSQTKTTRLLLGRVLFMVQWGKDQLHVSFHISDIRIVGKKET